MNISDWPLSRIMQLPDFCFGRRWLMSLTAVATTGAPAWDITELGLPELCVVWEFQLFIPRAGVLGHRWRLALGDVLPTSAAMFDVLEPLFPGFGIQGAEPRGIYQPYYTEFALRTLRYPIRAAGRRVIVELDPAGVGDSEVVISLVVSSIPKEVPGWLFSGMARSL